ncbi:Fur family ferric uptake transcriptional regulator [Salinibacterium sp. CAN_S4]|uniref:Fur family transcriptional regulator n=1 Tax=Salinibacterium sp. CAN_S4 TaxID=2787727 RepID=UPI0018EF3F87
MIRNTRQRDAIRKALDESSRAGFAGAQHIYLNLRAAGLKISLSTVYRGLHELALEGELDTLQNESEVLFRVCTPGPRHHHLVCRDCGKTVEVEGEDVAQWVQRTAAEYGYAQIRDVIDIFGQCKACAAERGKASK